MGVKRLGRGSWVAWVSLLLVCGVAGPGQPRSTESEPPLPGKVEDIRKQLTPGLSPAEVRNRAGSPKKVARQVVYQRCMEQWHFGNEDIDWLEFECRRGQEPRLQTVHLSKRPDR